MRQVFAPLLVLSLSAACAAPSVPKPLAPSPESDPHRELLDRMTGHWVLRGTIANEETTHDVDAFWVLNREYVQIHEVSRERDADGKPRYEAIVHVVWDPNAGETSCLWLDNTAAPTFSMDGVGRAKPATDAIPFVFTGAGGGIRTTFAYDRARDEWSWTIDNESNGKLSPFARVKLTRS